MAIEASNKEALNANPIRKIVSLLQNMQKEIEAEGTKEKELFDKFMCFCSGNDASLVKAAADATAKIEELTASLKSQEAEKVQVSQELAGHKGDRVAAAKDLEEATMLRGKEATEYAAFKADSEYNIGAMAKAIPALEKGMGASALLQLPGVNKLRDLVANANIDSGDRTTTLAFLDQTGDFAPQSGQIVGILKGMKDDFEAELKSAGEEEEKAIAGYAELKASKEEQQELATEAIEAKTSRSGDLAVSIVQTQDSLADTQGELSDTQQFLYELKTQCATKEKDMAERTKVRNEEQQALSETIAMLNDDDALDLFKKAVPSSLSQVNFLQSSANLASKVRKAQTILATLAAKPGQRNELKLLLFTLNSKLKLGSKGKAQNFDVIIKMVDDMIKLLGADQADDAKQKTWCEDELEKSGEEKKTAEAKLSAEEAQISEATDAKDVLTEEIATLVQEIKDLDKAVAEATEQRKEEHSEYLSTTQLSEAALELLGKAKNRLNKFYNPTLYKAPPTTERTMETKIIDAGTFVQVQRHMSTDLQAMVSTFDGEYKKSEKSAGVLGLMDMMIKEVETDMKDSAYEEKTAQKAYSELMSDSQTTRTQDAKAITHKEAAKADMESKLVALSEAKSGTTGDLDLVTTYISDLHAKCDFILQNFDLRKEARTNEVESLKTAKAILSGASFR